VRGLFYGDGKQFIAGCIGVVVCVIWVGTMTFLAMRLAGALVRNRVTAVAEIDGLDVPEMGIEGYTTEPIPE
jgi:Amt family ammonium transporter